MRLYPILFLHTIPVTVDKELTMNLVTAFNTSIQYASWAMRAFETFHQACDFVDKVRHYDRNEWEARDYVQVTTDVGSVASNILAIRSEYLLSQMEPPKNGPWIDSQRECHITQKREQLNHDVFTWNATSYVCRVTGEILRNKNARDALLDPQALMRLAMLCRATDSTIGVVASNLVDMVRHRTHFPSLEELNERVALLRERFETFWFKRPPLNIIVPPEYAHLVVPTTLEYPLLPDVPQHNEIFQEYTCPISYCPIRYPVKIVNGNKTVYYEYAAILACVSVNPHDPLTRRPLNPEDIHIDFEALNVIQQEMVRLQIPLE